MFSSLIIGKFEEEIQELSKDEFYDLASLARFCANLNSRSEGKLTRRL
jgi:hypothetical protein